MSPLIFVVFALILLVVIILAANIKIVPQSRAYVIEKLGA